MQQKLAALMAGLFRGECNPCPGRLQRLLKREEEEDEEKEFPRNKLWELPIISGTNEDKMRSWNFFPPSKSEPQFDPELTFFLPTASVTFHTETAYVPECKRDTPWWRSSRIRCPPRLIGTRRTSWSWDSRPWSSPREGSSVEMDVPWKKEETEC